MKLIKNVLFVVLMLTMVTGYAEEKKNRESVKVMTTLEFDNVKEGHELIIKDNQGNTLHTESIKEEGNYSKEFDLTALRNGSYTIELHKDFEVIIKSFKIDSKNVIFLTDENTRVFKPFVRMNDNKLFVSQLVLNGVPLKVKLYYYDEIIYTEEIAGEKNLQRIYSLAKTEKGDYRIVMTSGERTYSKAYRL